MLKHLVPSLALLAALPLGAEEGPPSEDRPITVSATLLGDEPYEQPYALYRHDRQELDQAVGRTALDRINYGPGVFVQSTAPNQYSPYIRGLTGEQTLLLIDGVRLSHATMRPGPNQYAALVPDMSISHIDAVLGTSAAATGSDGLTGALDLRLAEAGRGVDKLLSPWGRARIDHANGTMASAGVDGVSGDWAYSVEGGFDRFHDRIGGKDAADHLAFVEDGEEHIPNTAYDQYHGAARIAWTGLPEQRFSLKVGHTYQEDAPRPDGYAENSGDANRISRYFDPQRYTYVHLGHSWQPEAIEWLEALRSTLWYHLNDETVIRERITGGNYRRENRRDQTAGIGLNVALDQVLDRHNLTYGLALSFETTDNTYARYQGPTEASAVRSGTDLQDRQRTSVPDGSEYDTIAVFAQDRWLLHDDWELLLGLRYTMVSWDSEVEGREGFAGVDSIDGDTADLSGGVRLAWHFHEDMMAFAGLGKGFRAPNLTNLTGLTDRASSSITTAGNADLDPEISYTAELGWKYEHERDQLAVTVFATTIDDVIQAVYTDTNSDGIIDSNDDGRIENADGAELAGFELAWDYGLPSDWLPNAERIAVVGATSLVDAEIDQPQEDGSVAEEHLSRANRLYGWLGIRAEFQGGWWVRPQVRWHDTYDEVSPADDGDVRLTMAGSAEGRVSGYAVFDVAAGWVSDERDTELMVFVENLGNTTYREPGSAVDGAGFNVGLAGGVRF